MTRTTIALALATTLSSTILVASDFDRVDQFGRHSQVGPLTHPDGFVRTENGVVSANPPSFRRLPDGTILRNDGVRIPPEQTGGMIRRGNGFVSANPPSVTRLPDGRLLHSDGTITDPRRPNRPQLPTNVIPTRVQPIQIVNGERDVNVNYVLNGENHTVPSGRSINHVTEGTVTISFGSGLGFLRHYNLRPGTRYVFQVTATNGWDLVAQ